MKKNFNSSGLFSNTAEPAKKDKSIYNNTQKRKKIKTSMTFNENVWIALKNIKEDKELNINKYLEQLAIKDLKKQGYYQ